MILFNKTNRTVYLSIDIERTPLEPGGSMVLDHQQTLSIMLSHDYGSSAMSETEIISNDIDDSNLNWFAGHENPPVFYIVLDCVYEMSLPADAKIEIRSELLRPTYECAYDRLYPVASSGTVREVSCSFPERQCFEDRYKKAVEKPKKTELNILTVCAIVLGLMIILMACLTRTWTGLIVAVAMAFITGVVSLLLRLIGSVVITQLCKTVCRSVFSDFESDTIIAYYKNNKNTL